MPCRRRRRGRNTARRRSAGQRLRRRGAAPKPFLAVAARSTDARPQPFPWGAALHFGLGLLRLTPQAFWSLTICELMALGGALRPVDAPDRASLSELMRRWPDAAPAPGDGGKEKLHGTR
ncbi:rcc01693 family protein [Rhizobium sp.]